MKLVQHDCKRQQKPPKITQNKGENNNITVLKHERDSKNKTVCVVCYSVVRQWKETARTAETAT